MELIVYALTALFLLLALVIYLGKGDGLIAGYNTASEKERAKYNIKRLRLLMTLLMLLTSGFVLSLLYITPILIPLITQGFIFVCVVVVVLANTWGKK